MDVLIIFHHDADAHGILVSNWSTARDENGQEWSGIPANRFHFTFISKIGKPKMGTNSGISGYRKWTNPKENNRSGTDNSETCIGASWDKSAEKERLDNTFEFRDPAKKVFSLEALEKSLTLREYIWKSKWAWRVPNYYYRPMLSWHCRNCKDVKYTMQICKSSVTW